MIMNYLVMLSSKMVKNANLNIYMDVSHGLADTYKDRPNGNLQALSGTKLSITPDY